MKSFVELNDDYQNDYSVELKLKEAEEFEFLFYELLNAYSNRLKLPQDLYGIEYNFRCPFAINEIDFIIDSHERSIKYLKGLRKRICRRNKKSLAEIRKELEAYYRDLENEEF